MLNNETISPSTFEQNSICDVSNFFNIHGCACWPIGMTNEILKQILEHRITRMETASIE